MAHLEVLAGFSVPLTAVFADSNGQPTNPDDDPVLTIYNEDRKVVHTETLTAEHRTAVGHYQVTYTPPRRLVKWWRAEAEIAAEFTATVQNTPKVGDRHTITVRWSG